MAAIVPVTYSFLQVKATIVGPNGAFSIGSTAGVAEEGITIEFAEDQDTMQIGADGTGQHNLHAGQAGNVMVRLLKVSPTNALLEGMYTLDRADPASHGQNTISVTWLGAGDLYNCFQCGFRRFPANTYGKDGPMLEWPFNAIRIVPILGSGIGLT
jgi:hypothetical protein